VQRRIHKIQGEVVTQVRAALRLERDRLRVQNEEILEDVAEAGKDVFKPAESGKSDPSSPACPN